MINKFNLSLVNNPGWGSNSMKSHKDNHFNQKLHKPDLKEMERELGKNVVKTKMPRSRVYSKVAASNLNMNSTMGNLGGGSNMNKTGKMKSSMNSTATGKDNKFSKTATNDLKNTGTSENLANTLKK